MELRSIVAFLCEGLNDHDDDGSDDAVAGLGSSSSSCER